MKYVLDNSNLAESYSGATTPLTYSFAKRLYREVYKVFCRKMGVSDGVISRHEEEFSGLLVFVGNHMYYNLRSWYTLISFLPAYRVNRRFFDRMLGVESGTDTALPSTSLVKRYGIYLPRVAFQALRIGSSFLFMGSLVRRFNRTFDEVYAELESIELTRLDQDALVDLYHNVSTKLLALWWVPIANDFAVMVSTGLATKALDAWGTGNDDDSPIPHLRTAGSLMSLDPGRRLVQIVEAIREDEAVHELFRRPVPPAELHEILTGQLGHTKPNQLIQRYMSQYGARVPNELKLESETLRERPELLTELIQSLVQADTGTKSHTDRPASSLVELHHLGPLKRVVLKHLLSWAGRSIGLREETRFRRALIFGYSRRLFLALGQRLRGLDVLNNPSDVFFLTEDEVFSVVADPSGCGDIRATVTRRRSEMERWEHIDMPRRMETDGPLDDLMEELGKRSVGREKSNGAGTLYGTGASYGSRELVSGTALVLPEFRPDASFKDKVLVTRQTDPGWTIVFPFVKALVVERGGILSHAAIVARELGIPCIVGVNNATDLIADGATVEVMPRQGEVRIRPNQS